MSNENRGAGEARECCKCAAQIHACMGFVNAGDFLEQMGSPDGTWPRELCGKCALLIEIEPDYYPGEDRERHLTDLRDAITDHYLKRAPTEDEMEMAMGWIRRAYALGTMDQRPLGSRNQ